jgi:hypothetical protein
MSNDGRQECDLVEPSLSVLLRCLSRSDRALLPIPINSGVLEKTVLSFCLQMYNYTEPNRRSAI